VTDAVVTRYAQLPADDFKSVAALRETAKYLSEEHPASGERIEQAFRQWLANARSARTDELRKLPPGDWAAFDRTAAGRKALAEAFPECRAGLLQAEDEWVREASEWHLTSSSHLPMRSKCRQIETDLLALNSLDKSEGRFATARLRLFAVAHDAAQKEVAAHLEAGRYEIAFGLARKHAVDWNATAAILGAEELKKLDKLRETCGFFDKLASKAAKPADPADIAPEPRPKPEK